MYFDDHGQLPTESMLILTLPKDIN